MKGLIHVYKGEGKGKTTASVGLAVRAVGRGKRVIFLQFHKGNESGEINIFKEMSLVNVIRNTKDFGFYSSLSEDDKKELIDMQDANFDKALYLIENEDIDMIVLDEVFTACYFNTLDIGKLKTFIENKPEKLEIVLTGHNPDQYFIDIADYVTDMTCEKHPYDKGIPARIGIEM